MKSDSPTARVIHVAPDGDDTGSGTQAQPYATPRRALEVVGPGGRVVLHGGTYRLQAPLRLPRSGTPDAWIELSGAEGEHAILDADAIPVAPPTGSPPFAHDQGAVQIQDIAYVRIRGLTVRNSHMAGITVRDSHHVSVVGNAVDTTFGSGIAAWDSDHDDRGTTDLEIRDNTVTHANRWAMRPDYLASEEKGESPHEAVSLGGVLHFEVSGNHIYDCEKEGIDIKETSKHGRVSGNHIHHVGRQGIYVDAWFGAIEDVEIDRNRVHDCRGAGLVVSVENGQVVQDVRIRDNVVRDNLGSGLLFSRWGDGPRRRIVVEHNTFHHNGHGPPGEDQQFYWITGGIWLYSDTLSEIELRRNVVSDNAGFQIAASHHWEREGSPVKTSLREQGIAIEGNLVHPTEEPPVKVGWPPDDWAQAHPVVGEGMVPGPPVFVDPAGNDYRLEGEGESVPGVRLPARSEG